MPSGRAGCTAAATAEIDRPPQTSGERRTALARVVVAAVGLGRHAGHVACAENRVGGLGAGHPATDAHAGEPVNGGPHPRRGPEGRDREDGGQQVPGEHGGRAIANPCRPPRPPLFGFPSATLRRPPCHSGKGCSGGASRNLLT